MATSGALGDYPQPKHPIDPKEAAAYVPPTYTTQREYDALLDKEDKEYDQREDHSFKGTCRKCGGTAIVPFTPSDPKKILCRKCFNASHPNP